MKNDLDIQKIERLRKIKGWTRRAFADKAGVSQRTLTNILTGKTEPQPETLRGVSEALGVGIADLLVQPAERADAPPALSRDGGRDKLPPPPDRLFGPAARLAGELDAALKSDWIRVAVVAGQLGGLGKTCLVSHWLANSSAVAESGDVFVWSFNDQQRNSYTTADEFLHAALSHYGDPTPTGGMSEERAGRLAEAMTARGGRPVVVLDGLEPLQRPAEVVNTGLFEDGGVRALLRKLAWPGRAFGGLCVVTSQLMVAELAEFEAARQFRLDALSPAEGAQFLAGLGEAGPRSRLEEISRQYHGHPLSLRLVVADNKLPHEGEVGGSGREVFGRLTAAEGLPEQLELRRFKEMMRRYIEWYDGKPELELLRLLSHYDRPVEASRLRGLAEAKPLIGQATSHLAGQAGGDWPRLAGRLTKAGLVAEVGPALDLHPWVRSYLCDEFLKRHPIAARAVQRRIRDQYLGLVAGQADSLADLAELYRAVAHGCRSGDVREAFWEIYWPRVVTADPSTGEGRALSLRRFGCYRQELQALAHFCEEPWAVLRPELDGLAGGRLLGLAGVCLRATGRAKDCLSVLRAGYEALAAAGDRVHACLAANHRAEALRSLGLLSDARRAADESVALADDAGHPGMEMYTRTTLADILHLRGDLAEAKSLFEEAGGRGLVLIPSVRYCELLLTLAADDADQYDRLIEQAERALAYPGDPPDSLAAALHRLYKQFAHWRLHGGEEAPAAIREIIGDLERAGFHEHIALGWLTLARVRRLRGEVEEAEAALASASHLGEECGAKTITADCRLESARLQPRVGVAWHLAGLRDFIESEYRLRLQDYADVA